MASKREEKNQAKPTENRITVTPQEDNKGSRVRCSVSEDRVKKFMCIYITISIILSLIVAVTLAILPPITKSSFCKDLCLNGGSCQKMTCSCPSGWTGDYCGYDVDECQSENDLCLNGGTCANTVGSYVCVCTSSFMDYKCNTSVDDCLAFSSLCHNGGQCVNTASSYYCVCRAGYGGNDCSSVWQAIFSVSMSQPQVYTTNSTEWHISFDTVHINTVDMYNEGSSSVFIPTNGIYYFYYKIGLGNGSSISVKLTYLPHSGPVQPLYRNGSIFTSQTSLMTFSDIRQLNKSTIAFLSSEYPQFTDSQIPVTWGGFRIDDVSKPLIVFYISGARPSFSYVRNNFSGYVIQIHYRINFTSFALDTASAWIYSPSLEGSVFTAPLDGFYILSCSILSYTNGLDSYIGIYIINNAPFNYKTYVVWLHGGLSDSIDIFDVILLTKGDILLVEILTNYPPIFSHCDIILKGFYYGPPLPVIWNIGVDTLVIPFQFFKRFEPRNIAFSASSFGILYSGSYFIQAAFTSEMPNQNIIAIQFLINGTKSIISFTIPLANAQMYYSYPTIATLFAGDQITINGSTIFSADLAFHGFLLYPH